LPYVSSPSSALSFSSGVGIPKSWRRLFFISYNIIFFNFAYVRNFLGEQPISGLGRSNDDTINIYFRTTSDGLTQPLQVSDMGTGSDDNEVYFSGTYITA